MQGLIHKNAYGHEELKFLDETGGHVTIIKYDEETRYVTGNIGQVTSLTANGIGGTEIIKDSKGLSNNIAGVKRIRRLSEDCKVELVKFLKTFQIQD